MPTGELARRRRLKVKPADFGGLTETDLCELFDVTADELQHGIDYVDDNGEPLDVPLRIRGLAGLAHFERFASQVPQPAGALTRLDPYQRLILLPYFIGFAEIGTLISKGQGKTSLLAILQVYHLLTVKVPEVAVGAALEKQALKMYTETCRVANLPKTRAGLDKNARLPWRVPGPNGVEEVLLRPLNGYKSVRVGGGADDSEGVLKVLASDKFDSGTLEGSGVTLGVGEEVHAHKNDAVIASIQGGLGKRRGQLFWISTAGKHLDSLLGNIRANFRRDGVIRKVPQFGKLTVFRIGRTAILFEWALDEGDDIEDMDVVKQANPASFVTRVGLKGLRRSPTMTLSRWKRNHCGLWTAEAEGWLEGREEWDVNGDVERRLEPGDEIYLGVDPAWSYDTFSIVGLRVLGELTDRRFHSEAIDILRPGKGKTITPREVKVALISALERYRVVAMGYDKNRGFKHIVQELSDDHGLNCVAISMRGETWVPLTAEMRAAISTPGQWTHNADERYTSHVLSGETQQTAAGERLHGRTENKVDALMATGIAHVTAFGLTESTESVYSSRDGDLL